MPDSPAKEQTRKLEEALQRARAADAEVFDVRAKVRDLRYLRLDALRERLEHVVAENTLAKSFLTLRTIPGDPPRLILDECSHIVMQPDPRTFAFIHDGPETRQVLIETGDLAAVEEKVADYIAHRILEISRDAGSEPAPEEARRSAGAGPLTLLLFWLFGTAMGAVAVYIYLLPEILGFW
ncbi:MAG: hypothetical protein AAF441_20075 [Pseudomonadota bacterium]